MNLFSLPNRTSKMIECFVCSFQFENPQKLCDHLKSIHQLSGENTYKCTICDQEFTKLWKYRRHLILCFTKPIPTTKAVVPVEDESQKSILEFQNKIHKLAIEFVSKLAGNVSIPRNYVFELLEEFRRFFSAMISEGFNEHINPYVYSEQQIKVNYLRKLFEDPFLQVNNESRLDDKLTKADLIRPLKKVLLTKRITTDLISPSNNVTLKKHKKRKITETESQTTEAEGQTTETKSKTERDFVTIMPLKYQFKKFFELPNVFELTQKYANEVSQETMTHFINGKHWKKKLESYDENDIVIPYHLHTDDVQINNALGSHRVKGLETCTYYSFPTVPPEYNSRLENIFVAQLFPSNANKKYGNYSCFANMIEDLNKFAKEGVTLNINGEEQKVNNFRIKYLYYT